MAIAAALAQSPVPTLAARVNDPDGLLGAQAAELERKLAAFEQGGERRVAVLVLNSIGRTNIIEYTEQVMDAWSPPAARKAPVVLLVVVADQDNAWIDEHGSGLEQETAGRIIHETMVPRFDAGHDIAGGVTAGVDQLLAVLNGKSLPPPVAEEPGFLETLNDRLNSFRYAHEDKSGNGPLHELLFLGLAAFVGFGMRLFAGRWPAALTAAAIAGFGSWLQYGFIVPNAAVAFLFVFRGWQAWLGGGGKPDA